MSAHVMQMALAALVEALDVAGADLCGVNAEFRGATLWAGPGTCCDEELDAEGRVKMAIDALQRELGLQGGSA